MLEISKTEADALQHLDRSDLELFGDTSWDVARDSPVLRCPLSGRVSGIAPFRGHGQQGERVAFCMVYQDAGKNFACAENEVARWNYYQVLPEHKYGRSKMEHDAVYRPQTRQPSTSSSPTPGAASSTSTKATTPVTSQSQRWSVMEGKRIWGEEPISHKQSQGLHQRRSQSMSSTR